MTTGPRTGVVRVRARTTDRGGEIVVAARLAAAAAAAVLALTSTGSAVVAAVALGVALAERTSALAVGLVVVAASLRWGSSTFDEWAGVQSVLGTGIEIGPVSGAVSAWLCMVALVLVAGSVPGAAGVGGALDRAVPALALGALAAAVAVGPGPDGDLWMRVVATLVVSVLAFVVASGRWSGPARHRRSIAAAVALVAVVAAGWPT